MALQTYTWRNGTSENPVELNPKQLSLLLKLALDTSAQSDVRGHITTSSGRIAKYTKWQLNQKYGENLVIHAEEEADVFSIRPLRSAINEGESTEIIVTGMSSGSVKFRLVHSFRGVSGISQSAAEARIHMNGNILVVDNPQENAAWVDALTIQAIPIYEDWSSDVTPQTCTVTITAKEITGITLNAPSSVVYGEEFVSEVALVPSSNTKKNFVTLDATCLSDGTLPVRKPSSQGLNIYTTAPAEECELSLTVNAYLFGDTETASFSVTKSGIESKIPSIRFTVTTDGTFSDISSVNPKITLQKVDFEDTPIGEPIVLTGTVSGSSLVYTYGNGNVAGDGSETYHVSIENVGGYTTPNIVDIVPNGVITEVGASYNVIQPDVYIVYTDGTEQLYDDFVLNGMQFLDNKIPNYIHIIDSRKEFGVAILNELINSKFANTDKSDFKNYGLDSIAINWSMSESARIAALFTHLDATKNNIILSSLLSDVDNIVKTCKEYSIVYEEETRNGYLPSSGEAAIICNNMLKIVNIWKANGVETTISSGKVWSSTVNEDDGRIVNARFAGNKVSGNDLLPPNSTATAYLVPCFTL